MKINFSINGVKKYIEPDYEWWAAHWKTVAAFVAFAGLVLMLSGCAGMGGNEAYSSAHKSAAEGRIAEVTARAKAEETLAMAAASVAKGCESDMCRAMAMMTFSNMRQVAGNAVATAAPVIAAPVNEMAEVFKDVTKTALGLYGIRVGGAVSLVNATRGAADAGAAGGGLKALDIYTTTK